MAAGGEVRVLRSGEIGLLAKHISFNTRNHMVVVRKIE